MKQKLSRLSLALVLAGLMTACSSPVKLDEKAPVTDAGSSNAADTRAVQSVSVDTDPINDPKGVLANRSVYFDFDQYDVKEDFKPMLTNHAKYLASHPSRKVLVQGNTDERGGREYNLALGQKRAVAVTKLLNALGAQTSQLEAVSLGKEKPKAPGSNEDAWAENRRADIVY